MLSNFLDNKEMNAVLLKWGYYVYCYRIIRKWII